MINFNHEQQQIYDNIITEHKNFAKLKKSFFAKIAAKITKTKLKCGFYIFGKSGCGKTTLTSKVCLELQNKGFKVINMHFNDYFIDISRLLQKYNYTQIAQKIALKTDILCFDEFFIESIADAKILQSLFGELFNCGVFIIATSNFSPEDLFKGGFNREVVFPAFSQNIANNLCVIQALTKHDYRMSMSPLINYINPTNEQIVESAKILLKSQNYNYNNVYITTNDIYAEKQGIIAVFNYSKLLKNAIGIRQIIAIARAYHIICIENFTNFNQNNEDEAIRFRDLVDMLYLRNCNLLLCNASIEINFNHKQLTTQHLNNALNGPLNNIFDDFLMQKKEFIRTHSRLNEMQSNAYITSHDRHQKRLWCDLARNFFENL